MELIFFRALTDMQLKCKDWPSLPGWCLFDDINQGKMKMSITNEIDSLLWEAIKFVSVGYCKSLNHFFQDSETEIYYGSFQKKKQRNIWKFPYVGWPPPPQQMENHNNFFIV